MSYHAANRNSLDIEEAPISLTAGIPDLHPASRHEATTTAKTSTPAERNTAAPRTFYMGGRMRSYRMQSTSTNVPEINEDGVRRRAVGYRDSIELEEAGMQDKKQSDALDEKRHSTTVELSHIDQEDGNNSVPPKGPKEEIMENEGPKSGPETEEPIHVRTWTDRMHGARPDRHLFPYRSMRENMHAARTFLRRFFFLFLIIPAWVVPNVLTAKATHNQEISAGEGNTTALEFAGLKYMTLATSTGEEEEGPNLGKTAYWMIFLLNLLVMMHLGKAAGRALEELVPRFGMSIVSVFDAMTSSSVELACSAFALRKGLVAVVQAAMLGAILNNLLLMMGLAIVVGGLRNHQQKLKKETTGTSINILMITCIAYVIPIGLDICLTTAYTDALGANQAEEIRNVVDASILKLSKIMAIILLFVYSACLLYQYHSRTFMVTPEAKHEGANTLERRYTHFWFAAVAYIVAMGAQIYSASLLVNAVENLGRLHNLNDSFVGFILLPIVLIADLQEEVIAVRESFENRLDKAVALMVGSCMQIGLLVTPILVILGWIMDVPMTFRFTVMEAVILAGSVLIINYLISDHETNWLEGALLLAVFAMCAIAFYYYDNSHIEVAPGEGTTIDGSAIDVAGAFGLGAT